MKEEDPQGHSISNKSQDDGDTNDKCGVEREDGFISIVLQSHSQSASGAS